MFFLSKGECCEQLKMWPVVNFISLLGEFSENKPKTKDLTEKLHTGLNYQTPL